MTVYVVMDETFNDTAVIGIYAFKSQAMAFVKKRQKKDPYGTQYLTIKSFSIRGATFITRKSEKGKHTYEVR